MTRRPDPAGPDELEARRHVEEAWAANAAGIAAEARRKSSAAFWDALEARKGGGCGADRGNVTSITAGPRAPRA